MRRFKNSGGDASNSPNDPAPGSEAISELTPTARRVLEDLKQAIRRQAEKEGLPAGKNGSAESPCGRGQENISMPIKLSRFSSQSPVIQPKDSYSVNDFLGLHDEDFVVNAYEHILGRSPDSSGYGFFIKAIREGRLAKPEILARLRFSPEGRRRAVKVKGLIPQALLQVSYKIPVFGYCIALGNYIFRLPLIIGNFVRFESFFHAKLRELHDQFNSNMTEIEDYLEKLHESKADVGQLEKITEITAEIGEVKSEVEQLNQEKADQNKVINMSLQINENKRSLLDQQRRLSNLLEEARKRMPAPLDREQIESLAREADNMIDDLYVRFEGRFRGSREDIKTRAGVYLPMIKKAGAGTPDFPVLDIGCGRGEWLELLHEEGFSAWGVDINSVMVEECRELGFCVENREALACLQGLPDASLGALTGFHIIEHLPFKSLVNLLDEALRVIRPGGIAVFETPNPENLLVGACTFFLDPSHRHPLPPDLMQFLAMDRGFHKSEILRLHPDAHLKETFAHIPEISEFFAGPMDYAVIAYKANE